MHFLFADSSGNRATKRFFSASGVQLAQTNHDIFRFHRMAFYSQLKSKLGNILVKVAALSVCINLKMDDTPIGSFQIAHSPLTLSNLSPINIAFICKYPRTPRNPVYASRLDPSVLPLSLSLHRHPYIYIYIYAMRCL